jgi:Neuraminidase (sialidase)
MHLLKISCIDIVLIFISVSSISGQVFAPNVQVDEGLVATQYVPKILCGDDGALYVTWSDTRDGDYNVYFSRSEDGSRTWLSPNVRISDVPKGRYDSPATIAIDDNGDLYTTWVFYNKTHRSDKHVIFAKSTDRGDSWTPNVWVDDGTKSGKSSPIVCVGANGYIYVVWEDFRPYDDSDIYFARSTDGGETWTDPNIRINDDPSSYQHDPSMVIDFWGDLYVSYDGHPDGEDSHIYMVKSTDSGDTWSYPHIQIDDDRPGNHYYPELAVDQDGTIYASWTYRGGDHIFFAKSTDGGETWSRPSIPVDYAPASYFWNAHSSIEVDEAGSIFVSWDAFNYNDAEPDVFFGMSTDGGQTWTNPSVRVNDGTYSAQEHPCVTADGAGGACIVWEDSRNRITDDTADIYFSRTVPVLAYGEADCDTVASGGNLGVTITLVNTTGVDQVADIWTGMMLLTGGMYRKGTMMYGPEAFALAPYDTFAVPIDHEIPGDTPVGEYEYWVKVDEDLPIYDPSHRLDTDEDRYYLFKDSFTFTVVESEPVSLD